MDHHGGNGFTFFGDQPLEVLVGCGGVGVADKGKEEKKEVVGTESLERKRKRMTIGDLIIDA